MNRWPVLAAAILVCVLIAGCGGAEASGATATQAPNVILVTDNQFSPPVLQVAKGTKVTWQFAGKNAHSVVAKFGLSEVATAQYKGSGSYSFTFNDNGSYAYQCGVHGSAMAGRVIVN